MLFFFDRGALLCLFKWFDGFYRPVLLGFVQLSEIYFGFFFYFLFYLHLIACAVGIGLPCFEFADFMAVMECLTYLLLVLAWARCWGITTKAWLA